MGRVLVLAVKHYGQPVAGSWPRVGLLTAVGFGGASSGNAA